MDSMDSMDSQDSMDSMDSQDSMDSLESTETGLESPTRHAGNFARSIPPWGGGGAPEGEGFLCACVQRFHEQDSSLISNGMPTR